MKITELKSTNKNEFNTTMERTKQIINDFEDINIKMTQSEVRENARIHTKSTQPKCAHINTQSVEPKETLALEQKI